MLIFNFYSMQHNSLDKLFTQTTPVNDEIFLRNFDKGFFWLEVVFYKRIGAPLVESILCGMPLPFTANFVNK